MKNNSRLPTKSKSPLSFFLVAIALYIPFVVFARVQVLPNTSLVNFGAFIPTMAALILIYRENKISGVKELLKRSFDFQRIKSKIWYLPIFLLYPCIVAVQYGIAILFGLQVPSPHFSFWIPIMFVIVFIAALGEELGWMGYAFEPMQERLGTLKASVLLGVVWAAIHIPLFSVAGASPYWIMWQCIYIAVTRVLFVWIYSNTGKSLFAVSAIHATFNISWQFFPPSGGLLVPSFYDPRNLALTVIILTVIVVFFWGPGTLTQYRFAHRTADTKSVQRIDGRRASAEDIVTMGAVDLEVGLKSGKLSAVEVVYAYIAQIERTDAALNAVVVQRFAEARAEAVAADASRAAPSVVRPTDILSRQDCGRWCLVSGQPSRRSSRPPGRRPALGSEPSKLGAAFARSRFAARRPTPLGVCHHRRPEIAGCRAAEDRGGSR